ncbi:hypothetical protein [Actinomadura sp. 9N407]|uniref:hypothetical protein n=1 Tax=Actinomadura sp. 9N407 TaxID=3375154 RepID=UPI003797A2BC
MPITTHRHGTGRRRYREVVLGASAHPRGEPPAVPRRPSNVVAGVVLDASPHLLVLSTADGEVRLPMLPGTTIWHGERGGLAALRPGREVIVRPSADGLGAARVWVDIGRVTGTIQACGRNTVEVDMGPHRGRTHVVIPPHALGHVLVRHPRLEPGYLIDVICVRSADGPMAFRPGTSQPGHRPADLASPEPGAAVPETMHGTATWFGGATYEPRPGSGGAGMGGERPFTLAGEAGVAYPAVDPEGEAGGCSDAPSGCVALPYLSIGSDLVLHNSCADRSSALPVIECGCMAARFCDRCVTCDTSPRGRLGELTPAAFVALGGDLDKGCFNTVLRNSVPRAAEG